MAFTGKGLAAQANKSGEGIISGQAMSAESAKSGEDNVLFAGLQPGVTPSGQANAIGTDQGAKSNKSGEQLTGNNTFDTKADISGE